MSHSDTPTAPNQDIAFGQSALWTAFLAPGENPSGRVGQRQIAAGEASSAALLLSAAFVAAEGGPAAREIDRSQAQQSRLLNRFVRNNGLRWVRLAEAEGISVVAIKGLAAAHALYDDPDCRAMSDADLLVRRNDLEHLLSVFERAGLGFRPITAASRWGFVSDASFQPLTTADQASNIDLHIHADAWPLHRALTTEQVFADACEWPLSGDVLRIPCPLHMLLIGISHAARDRFQAETAKSFIDAARLLRRHGDTLNWPRFEDLCRTALMLQPARAFFALLGALGADISSVPANLHDYPRTSEFERALATLRRFESSPPGHWARIRREALLSSSPRVFLVRMALRAKGLARPNPGLPT